MLQYAHNKNNLYGIVIKNTDMPYELKEQIAKMLCEYIKRAEQFKEEREFQICRLLTIYLQDKYQGAWIVVIGRKFTANIVHEPGFFLRASTEKYHITVFKLKHLIKQTERQKLKRKSSISKSNRNKSISKNKNSVKPQSQFPNNLINIDVKSIIKSEF